MRTYLLAHDRGGFTLSVTDRSTVRHLAETAVEGVLAAVGHPCCGRGLGRVPIVAFACHALLSGVMVWASKGDRRVASIRLADEQARMLRSVN